jgi:putative hydrolase of the HAD superfamily
VTSGAIPVDVVLFDYGNVISRPQTQEGIGHLKALTKAPADRYHDLYWKDRFTYDRGTLSGSDYWTRMLAATGVPPAHALIDDLIRADVTSWLEFDSRIVAWTQALDQAGIGRAILSNMPADVLAGLRREHGAWLRGFTAAVFSCEVGTIKPEPAIFEHALQLLGVPAGRVLFIDDVEPNVAAAKRLGLHAIRFESADQLRRVLDGAFNLPLP